MSVAEISSRIESAAKPRITLESLAYAVILALGAWLRFFGLGAAPLSPVEAGSAWPAWLKAVGLTAPAVVETTSPLLYSLHLALFWLVGGGDAWARAASAVCGTALVWLPWLLRHRLGRSVAMTLSLLIAIDAWLVYFSRHADGTIFAVFFGLLAMIALERLREPHGPASNREWRWRQVLAVALGLLLVSGITAWSMFVVVGLNALFLGGPPKLSDDEQPAHSSLHLWALAGAAALLGSTAWLAEPSGIANIGSSFGWWLNHLQPFVTPEYPLLWVGLRLVVDQPILLVFGVAGYVVLWRGQDEANRSRMFFLTAWLLWAALSLVLPGRSPTLLPVLQLPLMLTAASLIGRWVGRPPTDLEQREAGIVLLAAGAILLSAFFWSRILIVFTVFELNTALVFVLLLLAVTIVLLSYGVWTSWSRARWALGVLLLVILFTGSLRSMWQLSQIDLPVRPDGFFATTTHPDVRNLATDLATISAQRTGDPGELRVQVQMIDDPDPVLGWYLRAMRRLDWVLAPQLVEDAATPPAFVTWAGQAGLVTGSYLGSDYVLQVHWLPAWSSAAGDSIPVVAEEQSLLLGRLEFHANRLWNSNIRPLLRWALYREAGRLPETVNVSLWVVGGE